MPVATTMPRRGRRSTTRALVGHVAPVAERQIARRRAPRSTSPPAPIRRSAPTRRPRAATASSKPQIGRARCCRPPAARCRPGTSSAAGRRCASAPSRRTLARRPRPAACSAATARSARYSCTKPMTPLSTTITMMATRVLGIADERRRSTAAAISTRIMKSVNCPSSMRHGRAPALLGRSRWGRAAPAAIDLGRGEAAARIDLQLLDYLPNRKRVPGRVGCHRCHHAATPGTGYFSAADGAPVLRRRLRRKVACPRQRRPHHRRDNRRGPASHMWEGRRGLSTRPCRFHPGRVFALPGPRRLGPGSHVCPQTATDLSLHASSRSSSAAISRSC